LERVRFTSPHPKDFTDEVIEVMAETLNVMPQLHMPLQSGSDAILKAMRRSYRVDRYLGIIDRVRNAMPEAAISTDIIVGFPGESETDFQGTLDVVSKAAFDMAFTFQYSRRPGTPAADMPNQVEEQVVGERYKRLHALAEEVAWKQNLKQIGKKVEILVANDGRKDDSTSRMTGRAQDFRLVHFLPDQDQKPQPGDFVTATITQAAPHHLVCENPIEGIRRSRNTDLSTQVNSTAIPISLARRRP
jgi:tRNA-2-methylthio-N6-dimethylallyladenosine synthase